MDICPLYLVPLSLWRYISLFPRNSLKQDLIHYWPCGNTDNILTDWLTGLAGPSSSALVCSSWFVGTWFDQNTTGGLKNLLIVLSWLVCSKYRELTVTVFAIIAQFAQACSQERNTWLQTHFYKEGMLPFVSLLPWVSCFSVSYVAISSFVFICSGVFVISKDG